MALDPEKTAAENVQEVIVESTHVQPSEINSHVILLSSKGAGQYLQEEWSWWKGYHRRKESILSVCPCHTPTGA